MYSNTTICLENGSLNEKQTSQEKEITKLQRLSKFPGFQVCLWILWIKFYIFIFIFTFLFHTFHVMLISKPFVYVIQAITKSKSKKVNFW